MWQQYFDSAIFVFAAAIAGGVIGTLSVVLIVLLILLLIKWWVTHHSSQTIYPGVCASDSKDDDNDNTHASLPPFQLVSPWSLFRFNFISIIHFIDETLNLAFLLVSLDLNDAGENLTFLPSASRLGCGKDGTSVTKTSSWRSGILHSASAETSRTVLVRTTTTTAELPGNPTHWQPYNEPITDDIQSAHQQHSSNTLMTHWQDNAISLTPQTQHMTTVMKGWQQSGHSTWHCECWAVVPSPELCSHHSISSDVSWRTTLPCSRK